MSTKINLILKDEDILSGYMNIHPYEENDKQEKVCGNFFNLTEQVDDGEAVEIRAVDILDFYEANESQKLIDEWIRKLAHGGKLIVGTVELMEVAKGIASYTLDVDQANLFLHGEQKNAYDFRKASFTIPQIVIYLESKGLQITKKRVANYRCIIEALRP